MFREASETEEFLPADQVRVSARELSRALAAIEARREAYPEASTPAQVDPILSGNTRSESGRTKETIPLGEAVSLFGLHTTPDELLAEIRAQRSVEIAGSGEPPGRAPARQRSVEIAGYGLCLMLILSLSLQVASLKQDLAEERALNASAQQAMQLMNNALRQRELAATQPKEIRPGPMEIPVENENGARPEPLYRPLSEVADNQYVACDFDTLHELANGKPPAKVKVDTRNSQDDRLWTISKAQHSLSVHAFATPNEAVKAMNGRKTHIYASTHPGMKAFVLPLDQFKDATFVDEPDRAGAWIHPYH